jgi:hypothetical protein
LLLIVLLCCEAKLDLEFPREVTLSRLDEGNELELGYSVMFSGEQTIGFLKFGMPGEAVGKWRFKVRHHDFSFHMSGKTGK